VQKKSSTFFNRETMNIVFLFTCLIVFAVIFFRLIEMFVVPIVLAATFSTLFFPWYDKIRAWVGGRQNLAALTTVIALIVCLIVPTYFVTHLVTVQSFQMVKDAQQFVNQFSQEEKIEWINKMQELPFIDSQIVATLNLSENFNQVIQGTGRMLTRVVNRTSAGAFELIAGVFLTMFSLFYFFRDGEALLKKIKFLSPLRSSYERILTQRFTQVARATVKGTVVIGIIQGIIGAVTMLVLGFDSWILWGVVMIILSVVPIVGSYFVLVPAGIFLIIQGNIFEGIICMVVATVANYAVDYLLRPRLVGHDSKVHDLIVLFSTLGGLALFGIMGFIIGPVIAVLFLTFLDMYGKEFSAQLHAAEAADD